MKRFIAAALATTAMALLAGCAAPNRIDAELHSIDQGQLPEANISLNIPGLGPCTDNPDRALPLNAQQPVTVLVHGCFGSSGLFRGLAQVLAFHGQQTACFTYNDRDSMLRSSAQLNAALDQLGQKMADKRVTVIGHSQGALVARKALVADRPDAISNRDLKLRLVTVSGPFAGIASANQCGNPLTRLLTLGLIAPMCQIVTGDKWSEITYNSPFIVQPGALHAQVGSYLKVVTDERGSCRRLKNGACVESDEIFSLEEQRNAIVDRDPLVNIVEVRAGHVEIVGDQRVAPVKLIAVLQQNAIIKPTAPQRTASLQMLLSQLYGAAN
jgi:pimeloyl-ACP methyl ester carboxylesterase